MLVEILSDDEAPHGARLSAAQAMLDRSFGKPKQPDGGGDSICPPRPVIRRIFVDPDPEADIDP